jgi:hypothetical protein
MSEQKKYATILPESLERTEIGPLEEEDAEPVDPVFAEWWKNAVWNQTDSGYFPAEESDAKVMALLAWQAHDAKIARLEADLEHFRLSALPAEREHLRDSIAKALSFAVNYRFAPTGGARQKAWVIDQMVRALTGEKYDALVARITTGENGQTYEWDCGVAP